MTATILLKVRSKRRAVTRKLALELWAVGLASAILLAIALVLNGPTASSAQSVGASSVEGGRLAGPTNPVLKAFMERVALGCARASQKLARPTLPRWSCRRRVQFSQPSNRRGPPRRR